MAELVDAHGSGPCAARRGGSSPLLGTKFPFRTVQYGTEIRQKARFSGLFCCLVSTCVCVGLLVSNANDGSLDGILEILGSTAQNWIPPNGAKRQKIRSLGLATKPRKIPDSGGLHLLHTPAGGKLWRFPYRFDGKQKLLSFGAYPAVSLSDARSKRDDAKKLLASGIDPSEKVTLDRIERSHLRAITFSALSDEFLDTTREGKAEVTVAKKRWLIGLARGDIGNRPITEITAAEILRPLRRVEADGNYETARRLRAVIGQVFRFAIATARAQNDPTGGLRGALITPKPAHRAAVTERPAFERLIRAIWFLRGRSKPRSPSSCLPSFFHGPANYACRNGANSIWQRVFGRYRRPGRRCAVSTKSR